MSAIVAPEWHLEGMLDHHREPVANILHAAERCFQRYGYAETTTRVIAQEAGVSKSLLHYHFQSKEHIFIELQINLYNRISDEIAAIISSHGTTTEKSLRLLDEVYRVVTQKDDLAMHVEIWSRSFSSPKLRRHLLQFREFLRAVFIRMLEALLGEHVEKLPVSIETAADLALYVLTGFKFHAGFEEDMERVHRAYADLTKIVLQILKPVDL